MSYINILKPPPFLTDDGVVNTPERAAFQSQSFLYRIFHGKEKKQLHDAFQKAIQNYVAQKTSFQNLSTIEIIWDQILSSHAIEWKSHQELSCEELQKILEAFEEAFIYEGEGVFGKKQKQDQNIRSFVDFVTMQRDHVSSDLLKGKYLKTILVEKDPHLMRLFRKELQTSLEEGFNNFLNGEVSEEVFQIFVRHLLTYIPFSYPEEGDILNIPTQLNEEWQLISYTLDKKILLTPGFLFSSIPAFGWISKDFPEAPPLLTFLGTTYPGGEGFMGTLFSDFTPLVSVGHLASRMGFEALLKWTEDKQDIQLMGLSLGGALSLHFASLNNKPNVAQIHAFNPPGLYSIRNFPQSCDVHIYYQWNDVVPTSGFFPETDNTFVYRILAEKEEHFALAHMRIYSGGNIVTLFRSSAQYENARQERKIFTFLHALASPFIFLVLLPLCLSASLLKKIYEFFTFKYLDKKKRNWKDISLIISMLFIGTFLTALGISYGVAFPYSLWGSSPHAGLSASIIGFGVIIIGASFRAINRGK